MTKLYKYLHVFKMDTCFENFMRRKHYKSCFQMMIQLLQIDELMQSQVSFMIPTIIN